ncbi:MAG: hypothetical protein ACOCYB_02780 [Alkalispirochaeta sp.]
MRLKRAPLIRSLVVTVAIAGVLAACAGDPEPLPDPPPPRPAPAPPEPPPEEPQPEPEPEPLGHAPLVGTRWKLLRVYGDMRRLTPTDRDVWVEFRQGETADAGAQSGSGAVVAQGPRSPIHGRYRYRVDEDSPRNSLEFEEGMLVGEDVVRERGVGSYSELEDALLENLQLLKGYYISGESPEESTLTIWGGFRSEEVVLLELAAEPAE